MWWFSLPAILKGWAGLVLTRGFAYQRGHKYDTGLLSGKRAMVSVTGPVGYVPPEVVTAWSDSSEVVVARRR